LVKEEKWKGFQFESKELYLTDLNPIRRDNYLEINKNELVIQWHFSSDQEAYKKDKLVYQLPAICYMG